MLKTAIYVGAGSPKSRTQTNNLINPPSNARFYINILVNKLRGDLYLRSGGGGFTRLFIFSIDGWQTRPYGSIVPGVD